jgi:hypothetical protein
MTQVQQLLICLSIVVDSLTLLHPPSLIQYNVINNIAAANSVLFEAENKKNKS